MSVKTRKIESKDISLSKVDKALENLVKVFSKHKLNVKEMLLVYGNLGYTLGASIAGYTDVGPSINELTDKYMINPTVDTALMLQGLQTTFWVDNVGKTSEDIKKENKKNGK